MKKTTAEEKKKIIALANSGLSHADIAKRFGIGRSTVWSIINFESDKKG